MLLQRSVHEGALTVTFWCYNCKPRSHPTLVVRALNYDAWAINLTFCLQQSDRRLEAPPNQECPPLKGGPPDQERWKKKYIHLRDISNALEIEGREGMRIHDEIQNGKSIIR